MIGNTLTRVLPLLSTLLFTSSASAQNSAQSPDQNLSQNGLEFSAKPDRCVALRKGQTCYQRVWLTFKAPEIGDYCLHVENQDEPIQCWSNAAAGKYRYEVVSSENVKFFLHHNASRVADVEVIIAWVYKSRSRRRTSWRLF